MTKIFNVLLLTIFPLVLFFAALFIHVNSASAQLCGGTTNSSCQFQQYSVGSYATTWFGNYRWCYSCNPYWAAYAYSCSLYVASYGCGQCVPALTQCGYTGSTYVDDYGDICSDTYAGVDITYVKFKPSGSCDTYQDFCTNGCVDYCTAGVVCGSFGACYNYPANACYTGDGTQTRTCKYTTNNNGSTNCTQRSFTESRSCTVNNCYGAYGYACSAGTCVTHIYVHIYIDYGHDGSNDAVYPYGTVYLNGGSGQVTGSDGSVTFSNLRTGTYTISYADNSIDYAPTSTSSQTVYLTNTNGNVNVYFRVTPLYRITGNIYNDNNSNANYDSGDSLYTGSSTIHVSGPSSVPDMTQTDGTYATPQYLWSGTYTVTRTSSLPSGYTSTTPTSYSVVVGNVAAPGPHCWGGTSNDAVCGNPNNGSLSGINFGVDAPYQISGNIFLDANHNKNYDTGDSLYTGSTTVRVSGGPTAVADMVNTDGTYSTGQVLLPGTYTVSLISTLPGGYTATTVKSWTVTVGYSTCNNGGSPDAACGPPNTGSISGLNFGLDAPYQISGRVYNDANKNGTFDGIPDTPFTGTPTITITGPTSLSVKADATSGIYTTGQVLLPGTYKVQYATPLPSGYSFQTASSWQVVVGYNPACSPGASPDAKCGLPNASSVNTLNFGLTNENAWSQSVCLDVRSDTSSYSDPIPAAPSCGGVSGAYNSITNGSCSTGAGIIFTCQATPDFGLGKSNALTWQAGGTATNAECYTGPGIDVIRTSYNYMLTTARQSNITLTDMNQASVCGAGGIANCTLSDTLPKGVYQAKGNLNLNGYTFPHPADPTTTSWGYIFLVNGNLRLNGNVLIPKGSVAAFSASGNIYVSKNVGQVITSASDASNNDPNLEGLYSADADFVIESAAVGNNFCNTNGSPVDRKLNVIGSIVTNAAKAGGSLINNRDLCEFDLSCSSISVGDGVGADTCENGGTGGASGSGACGSGTIMSYWLTLLQDGQFTNHKVFNWSELRP